MILAALLAVLLSSTLTTPLHQRRVTVTAYAVGDGFTPGVRAADGRLARVGTLAVSPDLKSLLWQKRVRLMNGPAWLSSGAATVHDLMSPEWTNRVDVFAPSVQQAKEWGIRDLVIVWNE